ncbi:DUF4350 domain-containing protein [Actinoplanes sp. N902-109]|uniref:DUF4350 domain-containing protein n=1 Tax=Actinoplanes sp. (strain N902-109) TaxID=649831 RepID=UPI0003294686|nr:DUF4350 domain-containing protein [Actinoplanes sp. N902-109]AGL15242.1 hypothetical protein L083_1732 [Actinoplanes sp. N902-109]
MRLLPRLRHPRRLRVYVPLGIVLALLAGTLIAHAVQQPDPTDAAFLSPASTAGAGASRVADELARQGRPVDVLTSTPSVLEEAGRSGPATVFITTPELVNPAYLARLQLLPRTVRVVVVAPKQPQLDAMGLAVRVTGPRWTAAPVQPGCDADLATPGPVAVYRWRYPDAPVTCYDGGVAELRTPGSATVTLVGAADPFRNDRAGEHDNHAFAVQLLARERRVIWLDLHQREQVPPPTEDPAPRPTGGSGPTADPDQTGEPWDDGDSGGDDRAGVPQPGDGSDGGTASDDSSNPLASAFPPAVWATLALLALAALALTAASARRLGTPVAEPLPVQVRAAETVRGLGGLYRRARARGSSLATLQAAARTRLIEHFGLPPGTGVDELAGFVAERSGRSADEVRHVLGGGVEDSDEELARAATELQRLVDEATERNVP